MGVGAGLYMYDVVVKSSRSLSHLLMSSCFTLLSNRINSFDVVVVSGLLLLTDQLCSTCSGQKSPSLSSQSMFSPAMSSPANSSLSPAISAHPFAYALYEEYRLRQ